MTIRFPAARHLIHQALDAILPRQCLQCRAMVEGEGILCAECWRKVTFIGPPHCETCGLPFEFDPGSGSLCGACASEAPVFQRARAAMIYDDASRGLILSFKHGDRTEAAPAFGQWLVRAGGELIGDADLLVSVPLHWTRLFHRRFNQAALLARAVGKRTGLPVAHDLLVRQRRTPSQGRLTPSARRRNVRGAFAAQPGGTMLEGQRVLLVDDVLTTGATASACARVLLNAGAGAVDVLTLARVTRSAP